MCSYEKSKGNILRRNICQKEAFRKKYIYTGCVANIYKHTDKDYQVYKEVLNAATNEVRKYNRDIECRLAQHIIK